MRLASNTYHMLVSSLPPLPSRFDGERPLISIERLQGRLSMLEADDAVEMNRLLDILRWIRQVAEVTDAAFVKKYDELIQGISYPMVAEVVGFGMDLRTILTALRRRRRNLGPPVIAAGPWLGHIQRHFNQPDFGLGSVFPWIPQFDRLLQQGELMELYRGITDLKWTYWKRRADNYYFTFEAVVLYVALWDVAREWRQLQAERGRVMFETLVTEVLSPYANI